jgi:hypothetical protein
MYLAITVNSDINYNATNVYSYHFYAEIIIIFSNFSKFCSLFNYMIIWLKMCKFLWFTRHLKMLEKHTHVYFACELHIFALSRKKPLRNVCHLMQDDGYIYKVWSLLFYLKVSFISPFSIQLAYNDGPTLLSFEALHLS